MNCSQYCCAGRLKDQISPLLNLWSCPVSSLHSPTLASDTGLSQVNLLSSLNLQIWGFTSDLNMHSLSLPLSTVPKVSDWLIHLLHDIRVSGVTFLWETQLSCLQVLSTPCNAFRFPTNSSFHSYENWFYYL